MAGKSILSRTYVLSRIFLSRTLVLSLCLLLFLTASSALAEDSIALNPIPASGKAPLQVTFNLTVSEEIISIAWDFDGDGVTDGSELAPVYTYQQAGIYEASANVTTASGSSVVYSTINVGDPFIVSVIAVPSSGIAPLEVQFNTVVPGGSQFVYAWDFDNDGVIDSTEQNPSYVFENVGDVIVKLSVQDSEERKVAKSVPVMVSSYDSKINLVSYFPMTLQLKENQVTFLVTNGGAGAIKDISAKIVGEGIQHLSSTTISRLKPGEQDSLTVKMNILQGGNVTAMIKIDEKIFPVTFTVTKALEVNKEQLELKLNEVKKTLQEQEDLYYQKKADDYMVDEIFDSIKAAKKQLQDAQQQMLTNHLEEAQVNVDMAGPAVDEIARRLEIAIRQEQTLLLWMKENAVAITAIIAAIGTLGGVAVKITKGAKKLGEDVKDKLVSKKGKGESAAHKKPAAEEPKEEKDAPKDEKK